MAEFKAKADKESSSTEKKYSVFFGRWQPWHAGHRWLIDQRLNEGRIFISIVPDIESINYGRGVGYDIIEHVPPQDIHDISATKIREQMRQDGKL